MCSFDAVHPDYGAFAAAEIESPFANVKKAAASITKLAA